MWGETGDKTVWTGLVSRAAKMDTGKVFTGTREKKSDIGSFRKTLKSGPFFTIMPIAKVNLHLLYHGWMRAMLRWTRLGGFRAESRLQTSVITIRSTKAGYASLPPLVGPADGRYNLWLVSRPENTIQNYLRKLPVCPGGLCCAWTCEVLGKASCLQGLKPTLPSFPSFPHSFP